MRANPSYSVYRRPVETQRRASSDAFRTTTQRLIEVCRLWRKRRRDRRELTRLDDRTLRDIGLTRNDAEFLINKPFWRA